MRKRGRANIYWYALFVKTGYEDYIGLFLKKSIAKYTEFVSFEY